MRHDPASGAIIIMLRSLKMHGMAQAVGELTEQGSPAFEAAVPILSQLLHRPAPAGHKGRSARRRNRPPTPAGCAKAAFKNGASTPVANTNCRRTGFIIAFSGSLGGPRGAIARN
jgi:hypothetical protein